VLALVASGPGSLDLADQFWFVAAVMLVASERAPSVDDLVGGVVSLVALLEAARGGSGPSAVRSSPSIW
jgi:hypothetical protein